MPVLLNPLESPGLSTARDKTQRNEEKNRVTEIRQKVNKLNELIEWIKILASIITMSEKS